MVRIAVNTQIDRPVQEVWDFFFDLAKSPRWTRSGSELRQTSRGALGVGTTLVSVRPILGREIKSQAIVVTQYAPGHMIAYTATVPLIGETTGGITFESLDGGTRLLRWGELGLGRAEGFLGPMVTRLLRSGWGTELANLKRLIEARS